MAGKPKHWTFLASSAAIVLCYNVPEIPAAVQLLVDRATVVQIYLRSIRFWNDTRLQALNPGVKLPGNLINLVYRSDASGTTNTFLQALSSFDPVLWPYPVVDKMTWPIQTKEPMSAFPAAGNYQGAFQVAMNPYTIGYISLPFAGGLPYFAMINRAGDNVTATSAAVQVNLPIAFTSF
jgi:phosphate transport system substrate-binding protein